MNAFRLFRNNLFAITKKYDLNGNKTFSLPNTCIYFCASSSRHTSNVCQDTPGFGEVKSFKIKPQKPKKEDEKPVDWLPFSWERRPKFDVCEQSGDTIRENTADPSLPKPDFELSDELKNADERVKQYFSLQTASHGEIKEVCRRQLLKRVQRHPNDLDSLEVKIALKTIQIRSLYQHKERIGKWEILNSKVVLPILIQKRNALVAKLREMDNDRYLWLLEELNLYFKPIPLSPPSYKYNKKWDLRQLTKQYCEKTVADKKAAYHEELKKQQADFLEEKKQILAWIEEEEKALNVNQ